MSRPFAPLALLVPVLSLVASCAAKAPPAGDLAPAFVVQPEPPPAPPPAVDGDFAIANVIVIDVSDGTARPAQTVVVKGDRIAAVGPSTTTRARDGALTVDGAGKFLIPGLWDMHAHVMEPGMKDFLRHGVTGVRNMFNLIHEFPDPKTDPAKVRPRLVVASHMLDGKGTRIPYPFKGRVLQADTAVEARKRVAELKTLRNAFVKVYSMLPAEAYFAAVAEAKEKGVTVAGHLPYEVSAAQASDAGQLTIEHLEGVAAMCSPLEKRCLARLRDVAAGKETDPHAV